MDLHEIDQLSRDFALVLSENRISPLFELLEHLSPLPHITPQIGQVWLLQKNTQQQLMLITDVSENIKGVIVLVDIWLATHKDIVLNEQESNLQTDILVGLWSEMEIDIKYLKGVLGEVSSNSMQTILDMLQREKKGGFRLRAVKKSFSLGFPMVQWQIVSSNATRLFYTGARTKPGDGRVLARKELQRFWKRFQLVRPKYRELLERLQKNAMAWKNEMKEIITEFQSTNPRELAGALRNSTSENENQKFSFRLLETGFCISIQVEIDKEYISILLVGDSLPKQPIQVSLEMEWEGGEKETETKNFGRAPVIAFPKTPIQLIQTMCLKIDDGKETRLFPLF